MNQAFETIRKEVGYDLAHRACQGASQSDRPPFVIAGAVKRFTVAELGICPVALKAGQLFGRTTMDNVTIRRILKLRGQGFKYRDIRDKLGVSIVTIQSYVQAYENQLDMYAEQVRTLQEEIDRLNTTVCTGFWEELARKRLTGGVARLKAAVESLDLMPCHPREPLDEIASVVQLFENIAEVDLHRARDAQVGA